MLEELCKNCIFWEKIKDSEYGKCSGFGKLGNQITFHPYVLESQVFTPPEFGCKIFESKPLPQN